jgi:alginate O-acetyltransferase complex protein AlgJ
MRCHGDSFWFMASTPTTIDLSSETANSAFSARAVLVRVLALVFLLSLFIPLIGAWRHWDFASAANENRRLAEMPEIPRTFKDAGKYSDRLLSFFRDHFGLRNTLIHAVAGSRIPGLSNAVDGNVIVGSQGWLFYRPDGDKNLIAFRGLNPLSDEELDAWQDLLEKRNAWLASKGIPLLVVMPPDKQTIYPEYLPPEYTPLRHQSRMDQLVERLRESHSPVHFIDLRPALFAAKPSGRLYHKTDTHWNDWGAFAGYSAFMPAVQELLPRWKIVPLTIDDFTRGKPYPEVGDLARMMDMPDQYPETGFQLVRKTPYVMPSALEDRETVVFTDSHDPTRPRLVLYRDSYAISLAQLVDANFSRIAYSFFYSMDPALIDSEKPDLVIDEFLERNLYIAPPRDPPEIRHFGEH